MNAHPAVAVPSTTGDSMSRLKYRKAADASRAGMTLVEIVVVVAILLVLTSVLSFGIYNIYEDSKRQVATLEVDRLGEQVFVYSVTGHAPLSQADGLAAIADGETPMDPWNNAYEYDADAPVRAGFDITSHASDGQPGGTGRAEDILHSEL
jgi:general secretion pathway protein G